jgi:hypothetical protein
MAEFIIANFLSSKACGVTLDLDRWARLMLNPGLHVSYPTEFPSSYDEFKSHCDDSQSPADIIKSFKIEINAKRKKYRRRCSSLLSFLSLFECKDDKDTEVTYLCHQYIINKLCTEIH